MDPNPLPRRIQISGDVAYFHCQISFRSDEEEYAAMERMNQVRPEMEMELNRATSEMLGKQFRIRSMAIGHGSIELFIALASVGTFYMGFSRYKNFIESVELLNSQVYRIVRAFMPRSATVTASWIPSGTLAAAPAPSAAPTAQWYTSHLVQIILIYYFIATHAAMLIVLVWLLLRRLP